MHQDPVDENGAILPAVRIAYAVNADRAPCLTRDDDIWRRVAMLQGPLRVVVSCGEPKCGATTFASSCVEAASSLLHKGQFPSSETPADATVGVWLAAVPWRGGLEAGDAEEPAGTIVVLDVQSHDAKSASTLLRFSVALASTVVLHVRQGQSALGIAATAAVQAVAAERALPVTRVLQPGLALIVHDVDAAAETAAVKAAKAHFTLRTSLGSDSDDDDPAARYHDTFVRRVRDGFRRDAQGAVVSVTALPAREVSWHATPGANAERNFDALRLASARSLVERAAPLSFVGLAQAEGFLGAPAFVDLAHAVAANLAAKRPAFKEVGERARQRHESICRGFEGQLTDRVAVELDAAWGPLPDRTPLGDAALVARLDAVHTALVAETTPLLGLMTDTAAADLLSGCAAQILAAAVGDNDNVARRAGARHRVAASSALSEQLLALLAPPAANGTASPQLPQSLPPPAVTMTQAASMCEAIQRQLVDATARFPRAVSTELVDSFASEAECAIADAARMHAAASALDARRIAVANEHARIRLVEAQRNTDRDARRAEQVAEELRGAERVSHVRASVLRTYRDVAATRANVLRELKEELTALDRAAASSNVSTRRVLADADDANEAELRELVGAARRQSERARAQRVGAFNDQMLALEGTVRKVRLRDNPEDGKRSCDATLGALWCALGRYEGLCRLMAASLERYPRPAAAAGTTSSAPATDVLQAEISEAATTTMTPGEPGSSNGGHPLEDILRGLRPRQRELLHPDHSAARLGNGTTTQQRASFGQRAAETESFVLVDSLTAAAASAAHDIEYVNALTPWQPLIACRLLWFLDAPAGHSCVRHDTAPHTWSELYAELSDDPAYWAGRDAAATEDAAHRARLATARAWLQTARADDDAAGAAEIRAAAEDVQVRHEVSDAVAAVSIAEAAVEEFCGAEERLREVQVAVERSARDLQRRQAEVEVQRTAEDAARQALRQLIETGSDSDARKVEVQGQIDAAAAESRRIQADVDARLVPAVAKHTDAIGAIAASRAELAEAAANMERRKGDIAYAQEQLARIAKELAAAEAVLAPEIETLNYWESECVQQQAALDAATTGPEKQECEDQLGRKKQAVVQKRAEVAAFAQRVKLLQGQQAALAVDCAACEGRREDAEAELYDAQEACDELARGEEQEAALLDAAQERLAAARTELQKSLADAKAHHDTLAQLQVGDTQHERRVCEGEAAVERAVSTHRRAIDAAVAAERDCARSEELRDAAASSGSQGGAVSPEARDAAMAARCEAIRALESAKQRAAQAAVSLASARARKQSSSRLVHALELDAKDGGQRAAALSPAPTRRDAEDPRIAESGNAQRGRRTDAWRTAGHVLARACVVRIRAHVDALDHGTCGDDDVLFHSAALSVLGSLPTRLLLPALDDCIEDVCRMADAASERLVASSNREGDAAAPSVALMTHVASACRLLYNAPYDRCFEAMLSHVWQDPQSSDIACLPAGCAAAARGACWLIRHHGASPDDWEGLLAITAAFGVAASYVPLYAASSNDTPAAAGRAAAFRRALEYTAPIRDLAQQHLAEPDPLAPLPDSVMAGFAAVLWNAEALRRAAADADAASDAERRRQSEGHRGAIHRIEPNSDGPAPSPLRAGVRSAVELPEDLQLLLAPSPLDSASIATLHPTARAAVRRYTDSIKELSASVPCPP